MTKKTKQPDLISPSTICHTDLEVIKPKGKDVNGAKGTVEVFEMEYFVEFLKKFISENI